ncbi:MAG: ATP-binding protein [Clostridia bacterium]|nr:ATP-binding protein [Clostridia bacterium]
MSYNNSVYKRIYDEYSKKYLIARERADERAREVRAKIPELAKIDKELSLVGLEIFSASLSGGDYKSKLAEIKQKNIELQEKRAGLLVENGYSADYSDVKYECEKCNDTGFIENTMCSCMREALTLAGIENSGFASLIKEQSFDNFSLDYYDKNPKHKEIMKRNLDFLTHYANSFDAKASQSILLMGGTGLGKTHLSSALARRVIEKGNDVFYTGAIDLFSQFETQRFKSYSSEPNEFIERYFECDLLIIDDLGTEMINQFSVSTLYNLLNDRLSRRKPTIISTNLSTDDIQKKYTDRITSRMLGEYQVLFFVGTDVRAQKLMRK